MTAPARTPLDAVVIGAGFAGLAAGRALTMRGLDIRIVDRAGGVGGTWWWNRYPGIACDVASHFYGYSFRPNPGWSRAYPPGSEIQRYLEICAQEFGLIDKITLNTGADSIAFDDASGLWRVALSNRETLVCRHVVSAIGGLHEPVIPDLPGLKDFNGRTVHTARWNEDLTVRGKQVAVIGSAASAIQAAPALARMGADVTVYQRTPNYIAPRGDHAYPGWLKAAFSACPPLLKAWRAALRLKHDRLIHPIVKADSAPGRWFQRRVFKRIDASVSDPELREALKPDYDLGCKRMLISDDFLEAVESGAVRLVPRAVAGFTETGVTDADGADHPADIVLFATGFDLAGHMTSLEVTGPEGRMLREAWSDGIEAHRGAAVAGFPNFWMVTGPNTGVGTTSIVYMIEASVAYIARMIDAAGETGLLSPRPDAQAAYNAGLQARLADTVWSQGGCSSWYKRPDGRIETLYPGSGADFRKMLERSAVEEYVRAERPAIQPA